jgi:hypothetical protein
MKIRALCWVELDVKAQDEQDASTYPLSHFRRRLRKFKLEVLPLSQHGIDIYRVSDDNSCTCWHSRSPTPRRIGGA